MNKSKTRNKYTKWPSKENFLTRKRAKNYCENLARTTKRNFFKITLKVVFLTMRNFGIQKIHS